jgi:hypothetical protein
MLSVAGKPCMLSGAVNHHEYFSPSIFLRPGT